MEIDKKAVFVIAGLVVLFIALLALVTPEVTAPTGTPNNLTEETSTMEEVDTTEKDTITAPEAAETSLSTEETSPASELPATPAYASKNFVLLHENDTTKILDVATVALDRPGYVVIYKINSLGKIRMVGHTDLLKAGTYADFTITLTSIAAKNQTVIAILHEDDGDGVFEYPESDSYILENDIIVSDIDIIEATGTREQETLKKNLAEYLEENS